MVTSDLDAVMQVEHASFQSPWKKENFIFDLTENFYSYYLVAVKAGEIIGYCGIWIVYDAAQITNIAVHPEERGNHYGDRLFEAALALVKLKEAETLTLEVRESNIVAQELYKKFGLEVVGKRERYYQDFEDALVMWVKL